MSSNPTPPNPERERLVKVLRSYPGITANMDLSTNSALVVDLADLILAERQVAREELLSEIEAKAPQDTQETEWSDKHQRFILHRPEEVSGFNAANDRWRSILKEVTQLPPPTMEGEQA